MTDPLEQLQQRLQSAQRQSSDGASGILGTGSDGTSDKSAFQRGMRIGCDLIAGVGAGVLLGLGFDHSFGTKPFGLLVFFVLGSMAGFWNIWRALNGQDYRIGFHDNGSDATGMPTSKVQDDGD